MKEFPQCPCIPGVSWQPFGLDSLKNLAFHIAPGSFVSSSVQRAEGEECRQGKSTFCFILCYSLCEGNGSTGTSSPFSATVLCLSDTKFGLCAEVLWFNKDPDVVWVGENGAKPHYLCYLYYISCYIILCHCFCEGRHHQDFLGEIRVCWNQAN